MKAAITDFIFQDVKNENETKRIAVLLRLNVMVMWSYYLLLAILFYLAGCRSQAFASMACFAMFTLIFYLTYQNATKKAAFLSHVVILFWIVYSVYTIGWDSGVQHLIFVLVLLGFLTSLETLRRKIFYAVFLCIFRLALYFYTMNFLPVIRLQNEIGIAFQIINTCAICGMITASLCLYNMDSLDMEQKLVAYNEKLHRLAQIDPLTGLYNRRGILEYLETKSQDYQLEKISNLCLAIGDIDFFKKINDRYGHECGDLVLKELGSLMDRMFQGKGRVGRWGGEEFLFVLPAVNGDEACVLFQQFKAAVRELNITYNNEPVPVTLTFGISEYDCRAGLNHSIDDADKKLYLGKEMGRNRVIY